MLLIGYRLALWERANLGQPAFQSANALMSLSFVAAAFLTLSRMAARLADPEVGLSGLGLVVGRFARRVGSAELAGGLDRPAARLAAVVHGYGHHRGRANVPRHPHAQPFDRWEELEIFAVAAGIGLLAVGHVGWYREEERQEDMVSFNLLTGACWWPCP